MRRHRSCRTWPMACGWAVLIIAVAAWGLHQGFLANPRWVVATTVLMAAGWLAHRAMYRILELRRMEEWMRTQRDLAAALGATSDLTVALTHCLGMALQVSRFDGGGVYVVDDEGGLHLCVHQGLSGDFTQRVSYFAADSPQTRQVMTGQCYYGLFEQLPAAGPIGDDRWAFRAVAIVPIQHNGQVVACLNLVSSHYEQVVPAVRVKLEDIAARVGAVISRIQAEEYAREQDDKLRMLTKAVEQSSSTIVITDRRGVIEYVNPQFAVTTGYSAEEALGRNPRLLCSGEQPKSFYAEMWNTISSGRNWHGEFRNRRKDGTLYWESATISPIADQQGRITHFVAIKDDISQQKQAMEELKSFAAALQSANTRLADLNRLAERAVHAKSEFLANMSHEIRTPMTAILGYAEILAESVDQPEQYESVEIIKRNGDHLLKIINDILDLSKIEAGKLTIDKVSCSPMALFSDVVSLMQVRAKAKGLPLQLEYQGLMPQSMRSDPVRLRQILINLVGNAIKFTETGTVRLLVSLLEPDTETPRLRCDVVDTGIGMDPQQCRELFQPFHQVDSSHSRNYGGTGLGLVISKRLAEMLGGDITVTSQRGQGSTFSMTFAVGTLDGVPLVRPSAEVVAEIVPPHDAHTVTWLKCRVLLAEDGPDNQRLVAHLLRRHGVEVEIAGNGREAVEKALSTFAGWGQRYDDPTEPYDVILMDMQMPVLDGYDATRRLRAEGYQGPIIALTAHAMKGDREKCLAAGCDAYLAKPIDRAALVDAIARCLRKDSSLSREMFSPHTLSVEIPHHLPVPDAELPT